MAFRLGSESPKEAVVAVEATPRVNPAVIIQHLQSILLDLYNTIKMVKHPININFVSFMYTHVSLSNNSFNRVDLLIINTSTITIGTNCITS